MRSASRRDRPRRGRRVLGFFIVAIVCAAIAWVLWAGGGRPSARLESALDRVGAPAPLALTLRAGRPGLAGWVVRVRGADGRVTALSERRLPRRNLLGSGVRVRTLDLVLDPRAASLPEGPAALEVLASDYGPLALLRGRELVLRHSFAVDLTPPTISALGSLHYVRRGGSDLVTYRVGGDEERSGVEVAGTFFPGVPVEGAGRDVRAALYAFPYDAPADATPELVARDRAGNEARAAFPFRLLDRTFPADEIEVSDSFLRRKIPPLLQAASLAAPGRLIDGYLLVNRKLRARSDRRLAELASSSSPRALFRGGFLQQPGTVVRSTFAERRTYRYRGAVVDHQTHLGYDLASIRHARVLAANAGRVRFAGPLGIYGNAVVLDHGLGLATLYAHLSEIAVTRGDRVGRGDVIGRSGETGLAGGDHLHFGVLLRGVAVDPLEWWDERWVRLHVEEPLAEARGATDRSGSGIADAAEEAGSATP